MQRLANDSNDPWCPGRRWRTSSLRLVITRDKNKYIVTTIKLKLCLPVLSAQLMTAPTGKPRDIRNLAPAEPPRPEKSTLFYYVCIHNLMRGRPRWRTNACMKCERKTSDKRQGVDAFGRPTHVHTHFHRFGRRQINNYCKLDEKTYLFWTLWCAIRARQKKNTNETSRVSRMVWTRTR